MALETHDLTNPPRLQPGRLARPMLLIAVILCAVTGFLMFSMNNAEIFGSYLFGLMFWVSLTIGMFGMSILHYTVRGRWSIPLLRIWEAGGGWVMLLVMGVLFLPIVTHLDLLYQWTDQHLVATDHVLQNRARYMNTTWFTIRWVLLFLGWAAYAFFMRGSDLRQERNGDFKLELGRSSWGAAGIPFFFLSVTLGVTDWLMSMDIHWYSTMFAAWYIICSCGAGLAFALMIFNSNSDKEPYRSVLSPELGRDQGNMQFVLTMLWGYTSLSQFIILWNGNIPETTSYYKERSSAQFPPGMESNNWGAVGLALMIGRFFVPFFCLLTPRIKRFPENLRLIGGWIVCMHIIEMYMFVTPSIPGRGQLGPIAGHLGYDLLAFCAVGAVWLTVFALQVATTALIPTYDNRLEELKHAH